MSRPRLLYFNGPWDYVGERIRESYIAPFRRLLEQDFEVISIEGDCDFRREVEAHRPDLALFHTGCEAPHEPEVKIVNTDAFPELPRLGWVFRDPFSPSRAATMNRMLAWGVHQVVADFRPSDALSPWFEHAFYLPWWVDDAVFRDYGEAKSLWVALTGSGWFTRCIYTWRPEICRQLLPKVPIFHVPGGGNRRTDHDYTGENYARLLNRSRFAAGCGTVARYVTLKLLEIPASRCCLVTEETAAAKALGFRDGVNCVFAGKENVVDRLMALANDEPRLRAITDAGFKLVHEKHTQRQRRVFAEWYQLWKNKAPGERVVQVHPLEPLRVVPAGAPAPAGTFPIENPLNDAVREGYALLAAHRWADGLAKFDWVIGIVPCVAEARLGAALCHLRLNRPADALPHLRYNLWIMLEHFRFSQADPIDMALMAALLMRLKDAKSAVAILDRNPDLRHPALNAARWIFAKAQPALTQRPAFQVAEGDETVNTATVHILPQHTFREWVALLMSCLK
ncbi:MAG: glycosyltransferase family 1 protein [Opitutaceae bacterium]|nr:glycosyltransferase family 1 protein [Opitutaceae bacterium]